MNTPLDITHIDRVQLERVRLRLLRQASLFEDPAAYAAGVHDAMEALIGGPRYTEAPEDETLLPAGGWFG